MPARTLRATSGKLITIIAMTTAFHVKITSMPIASSAWPSGLRRPNSHNSSNPVATGGSTSGSETIVSSSVLPANACARAASRSRSPAAARATSRARHQHGEPRDVPGLAAHPSTRRTCSLPLDVSGDPEVGRSGPVRSLTLEHCARGRALQEFEKFPCRGFAGPAMTAAGYEMSRYGCSLRRDARDDAHVLEFIASVR